MKHSKYSLLDGEEYPESIAWFPHHRHQEHFESTLEEDISEIFFAQEDEELATSVTDCECDQVYPSLDIDEDAFGRIPSDMWNTKKR